MGKTGRVVGLRAADKTRAAGRMFGKRAHVFARDEVPVEESKVS